MPHGALLHWATTAGFTLGLQLALQQPALRAALNLPTQKQLQVGRAAHGAVRGWENVTSKV